MNQVDITEAQKDFYKLIVAVNRGNYIALIEDEKPVAVSLPFSKFCDTLGVSQDIIKANLLTYKQKIKRLNSKFAAQDIVFNKKGENSQKRVIFTAIQTQDIVV